MILAVGLQIQIVYGRQIMFQRQFTATGPACPNGSYSGNFFGGLLSLIGLQWPIISSVAEEATLAASEGTGGRGDRMPAAVRDLALKGADETGVTVRGHRRSRGSNEGEAPGGIRC